MKFDGLYIFNVLKFRKAKRAKSKRQKYSDVTGHFAPPAQYYHERSAKNLNISNKKEED